MQPGACRSWIEELLRSAVQSLFAPPARATGFDSGLSAARRRHLDPVPVCIRNAWRTKGL